MMKKLRTKAILFTLLPISLLANIEYDNEVLKKAVESYNNRLFQDSYIALIEYMKKDKLDKNLSFILARSAYETGNLYEAEQIYKELLSEFANNNRVKLELAQTYFKQNRYDEAEILYNEVLKDSTLPLGVRKNIELTLNSLHKKSQKNFFKTTLGIGYGYDSNVNNTSSDDYVYWGSLPLTIPSEKSDHLVEYIASFNHTYKLNDSMTIDNKLVGYKQNYSREKYNNLSLVVLGTGVSYYQQNYKLSFGFDYNYVWLDNNSYLKNYLFTPSLEIKIDDNLINKTTLKILKKDFTQKEQNFRDSTYYELQDSVTLLTNDYGINRLTLALGKDKKSKGSAWNVDYNFFSIKYDNLYPITPSTLVSSAIEYYIDRYRVGEDVLYKNKKHDNKITLDAGVLHSVDKNFSIGASFRYINNDSNQNIYEYDKYTLKTNIYYSF